MEADWRPSAKAVSVDGCSLPAHPVCACERVGYRISAGLLPLEYTDQLSMQISVTYFLLRIERHGAI